MPPQVLRQPQDDAMVVEPLIPTVVQHDWSSAHLLRLLLRRQRVHQRSVHVLGDQLEVVDAPVESARAQKLRVRASLRDSTPVHHENEIGVADRRQAVSDDEGRASLYHLRERLLQFVLRLHVDAGGGVVEYQDGRVEQDRARYREPLPLAPGQLNAALPDPGLVLIGQALDEVVKLRHPCGLPDLLIGRSLGPVGYVVRE